MAFRVVIGTRRILQHQKATEHVGRAVDVPGCDKIIDVIPSASDENVSNEESDFHDVKAGQCCVPLVVQATRYRDYCVFSLPTILVSGERTRYIGSSHALDVRAPEHISTSIVSACRSVAATKSDRRRAVFRRPRRIEAAFRYPSMAGASCPPARSSVETSRQQ